MICLFNDLTHFDGDTYLLGHDHRYSEYTSLIFNFAQIRQTIVIRCCSPIRSIATAVTSPCAAIVADNVPAVIGLCKGTVSGLWKRWKFPPVTWTHDPLGFRKAQPNVDEPITKERCQPIGGLLPHSQSYYHPVRIVNQSSYIPGRMTLTQFVWVGLH